jgi:PBP1b-binding outer membrane lipoprotein LpoB
MRNGIATTLLLTAALVLQGCGEPDSVAAVQPEPAAIQSEGLAPVQFASVAEMIEDRADYAEENGSFKLVSAEPLHIQLAAQVVANDLPEVIQSEVNRAALYGIYRTFIHTRADSVRVTALPMEITLNPYSARYLAEPKVDLVLSRDQALKAAQQLAGVVSFDDIVTPDETMGMQMDSWSTAFKPFYFEDAGQKALLETLAVKP